MKQLLQGRGAAFPILIATNVVLLGLCLFLYFQPPVAKTGDGRSERALLSEMQTLVDTVISDDKTIHHLKDQLNAAGQARLPAENPIVGDVDPNLYPTFRSLPEYRPTAVNAPGALASGVPWKQDVATLHDQMSGIHKELLSSELKSDQTREDMQSLRRHIHGQLRESSERLAAIAARDERRYIYFDLQKTKAPIQVDDLQLVLTKADPKHNRFTCDLIINNVTIAEKNRSRLEPIQIYLPKYKRSCEMVIRDIRHNEIAGYLSVPAR